MKVKSDVRSIRREERKRPALINQTYRAPQSLPLCRYGENCLSTVCSGYSVHAVWNAPTLLFYHLVSLTDETLVKWILI